MSWTLLNYKSSSPEVFCKEGVLRNFAKFTGKHLGQSVFFNKVAEHHRTPVINSVGNNTVTQEEYRYSTSLTCLTSRQNMFSSTK